MTEELAQLAEIISSLGDKGVLALAIWVVADLLDTLIIWGFSAWTLIGVGKRIKESIVKARKDS